MADEVVDGEYEPPGSPDERRVATVRSEFVGPLPPPAMMREYEEIVPGAAREMLDQWKAETAHRHETITAMRKTDDEAMRLYFAAERRGQYIGLAIGICILVLGLVAVILDRPVVGAAGLLGGAAAVIWAMRRKPEGPPDGEARDLSDGNAVQNPAE